jgi:ATP/maltotriose-dependent transcriptional regulator MalT
MEDTLAPNELRDIGLRASSILERCGELDAAVALHVRNQDWESLLGVTFRHGIRLLARGHASSLRNWITAFPANVVSDSTWLGFWSGVAMTSERRAAARIVLENAWSRFEQSADAIGRVRLRGVGTIEEETERETINKAGRST